MRFKEKFGLIFLWNMFSQKNARENVTIYCFIFKYLEYYISISFSTDTLKK